jgi:hypothetical protein
MPHFMLSLLDLRINLLLQNHAYERNKIMSHATYPLYWATEFYQDNIYYITRWTNKIIDTIILRAQIFITERNTMVLVNLQPYMEILYVANPHTNFVFQNTLANANKSTREA